MSAATDGAAILAACRAMNASGLNQGTAGNISMRDGDGMLITPSGVPYDDATPEMMVPVAADGTPTGRLKPSSEWRMHLDIYRAHARAQSVVHVHSPYATALSCHRRGIPAFHYMVAVAGGADIRCADYATFGTQELSDAMLAALEGRTACLLANHGQIAFGPSLDKTLALAHEVETLARQYLIARALGEPAQLDGAEMGRVLALFADYGHQPDAEPG
ncbi:class II aldolase/adducin family protein [Jannaschia sp.]|nr:class II aldolase/adducin family protein [Jannaschia sp.]